MQGSIPCLLIFDIITYTTMPVQYNEWDSQGMSENFTNTQLWEHVHLPWFMDEIRKNEAIMKLRGEYGKKLVEAIEKQDQAGLDIADRNVLLPIVEEYRDKLSKIK